MSRSDLTYMASAHELAPVLERGIEALAALRRQERPEAMVQQRVAARISDFAGRAPRQRNFLASGPTWRAQPNSRDTQRIEDEYREMAEHYRKIAWRIDAALGPNAH